MDHPGPSDGRTPDIRWKMIKDRYGKPVLSPNDGADVPDSGCPGTEQSFGKIVTMENTSRNGTRFKQVGRNRFRKPWQPPVRGGWGDKSGPDSGKTEEIPDGGDHHGHKGYE